MKKKMWLAIILGICVLLSAILLFDTRVGAQCVGGDKVAVEYGETYTDEGVKAYLQGKIFGVKFPLSSIFVKATNNINYDKVGDYHIDYDIHFLLESATKQRVVSVVDTQAPVITLVEDDTILTPVGQPFQEIGFSAEDNYDGDLTDQVVSENDGKVIHYTVTDSSGNVGTAERTINYLDTTAPVISFVNGDFVSVSLNSTYSEPGYSTMDDLDGDVTDQVTISGSVDTSTAGYYSLHYTVTDAAGNTATAVREVLVVSPGGGNRVIYLTFDDGPGPYTQQLLDILDKYNVKATFFVTHSNPGYENMIGEAYRRGHSIGVHAYTHNYAVVYASVEAYMEDFNKMEEVIEAQTGSKTSLFRFPGGSSNTVSCNYCSGIMTTLAKSMQEQGYHYFDWNVTSGDAGETTSTDQVYKNVVVGCSQQTISIVLQHDIKGFSVNAVERIIQWGLANGYTFAALNASSPTAHHRIAN